MQSYEKENIRNIVLLSHNGVGKTILGESMLFKAGAISRLGRVEDGNTVSDFESEEVARGGSVSLALLPVEWKQHKLNIIDTPGYADFHGEVISGLRVADMAIFLVAAPVGVEVGTELMWEQVATSGLPSFVFVNKMSRENADFNRAVESIRNTFGRKCVALQLPVGAESNLSGLVNLIDPKDIPAGMEDEVSLAREALVEAIAETDDALTEKYLEEGDLDAADLVPALKSAIASQQVVPILVGDSVQGVGIEECMDTLAEYGPAPMEVEEASGAPSALIFKTTADPFVGKLSYFRLYSGSITSDSQIWNLNQSQAERLGQVFIAQGKTHHQMNKVGVGDIGVVPKLAVTATGNTMGSKDSEAKMEGLIFDEPVFSMAVYPKGKQDLDKMTASLTRLVDEDPSLKLDRNMDTAETVISGAGETHLDVAVEKAKRKFGVELLLQPPKVFYKETITRNIKAEYKHKKQSGGHGQYGHVFLELEPLNTGEEVTFDQKVVGGAVPREYIPAVEKGVVKSLSDGVVAGFPVVGLKVTLFDGSFHPVDSSGMSFEIAGNYAIRKGVLDAAPTILEPVHHLKVTVPDAYAGEVMGDLNSKRGKIGGMNPAEKGHTLIEADAPEIEIQKYATALRSLTQGRGSFSSSFSHYEPVPANLVDGVIENAKRQREEVSV